ncbi:5969_t:CDS:2 [Dentiscutata heterogama]|uniref:5969_t:CDS:1 n=1 Tax=Dentiscutata heterogama TaxID=1316150 RepID=A0ACA9JWD9_9GLOM|nr:5969_t:CDS:2 [Dentiscutata heterogama]
MGKRKRSFRPPPTYETGNDKFDNQGGRIKAITTWDDIEHDSEDEFYAGRDQISLDTYESHKRDETELSEEEADRKQIESTDYDNDFDLISLDREVSVKERLNLSRDDVIQTIQSESPELIELLNEFKEKSSILWNKVTPLLEKARQKNLTHNPAMKFISIKHQTLVHYLINISFYLALKSSGTQNLRKHPVIDALGKLRMTWDKLERLERNIEGILEWNDYDKNMAADLNDEDPTDLNNEEDLDDFYNMVKEAKKATKEQRMKQFEMERSKNMIVYEDDNTLPEGAKRQINYQILKNKGLTPHRKKEQRNPRVKHRNKYEKAKKKIKSIKRLFSQQEGSYGGEKTGIKTGLSRSIKLE